MSAEQMNWNYDGQDFKVGFNRVGNGPTLLLLPALSSISTRQEIQPLQEQLATSYSTIAVDWPGFGEHPKPFIDWRPEIYQEFLNFLFTTIVNKPDVIIAAGHAAGYILKYLANNDSTVRQLVLLSPTWRGPLPTMMNGDRAMFASIARAVDRPFLGPLLYRINVNRFVIGMMARGHVYADPQWLKGQRLEEKLALTQLQGARHGSVRFVTGRLDPFRNRTDFLATARRVNVPILNIFSVNAPRKSQLEMEALAELPHVKTVRLPQGKLSFYEEFPDNTFKAIGEIRSQ